MKKITIYTDGFEGYRKRSLERAMKVTRGERLEPQKILTLENGLPSLTRSRMRLFHKIKEQKMSITSLAKALNRTREAVSRDVAVLESCGMVKVSDVPNPGHGRTTIVSVAAQKIMLEL